MTGARVMRTLGCFAVLSVLVHLWILYGTRFELSRSEPAPLVFQARLQPAAPLPPVVPRARPPRARLPAVKTVAAPVSPLPDAAPVFAAMPEPVPAPPPVDVPAAAPVASTVVASAPPPAANPPLARRLPRKGAISYVLYLGSERLNVGRTTQNWELSGDSYRLASLSETTGLAAVFSRQRIAYESRGKLTARGLRPEHFTNERVRSGKSEKAATNFDWTNSTAAVGNPASNVALPADTQDLVSFMYQMGLGQLTPGRIELPVTNGWKLERYELEIGSEESLETPLGSLRAVPVRQVRHAAQETIELWLAPAYRWLPVRIRFFNREGEPAGEQLVSEILVSED